MYQQLCLGIAEQRLKLLCNNRNLEKMITSKQFREDLWFRLNVFPIHIPPLRERKEDIPVARKYSVRTEIIDIFTQACKVCIHDEDPAKTIL